MNILIDPLPGHVVIDGAAWSINSSFFIGIQFELLMQDRELTDGEKVAQALALYYPEIPPNLETAMERLLWFYSCGKDALPAKAEADGKAVKKSAKKTPKAYCFEQDAPLILAAFWAAYHLDLNEVEGLHWWKFRALFAGLPAESEFCKVMGYRTADTTGLSKKQKQHYERLKKLHALKNQLDVVAALTLAERNQRMKDYVTKRYEEVEAVQN